MAVLRRAREAYEARMRDMDVSVRKLMAEEELWQMKGERALMKTRN